MSLPIRYGTSATAFTLVDALFSQIGSDHDESVTINGLRGD